MTYLTNLRKEANQLDAQNKKKVHNWLEISKKVPLPPPPPKALPKYIDQREAEIDNYNIEQMVEESNRNERNKAPEGFVPVKPTEFITDRMYDARLDINRKSNIYFDKLVADLNDKPFDTVIDFRKLDSLRDTGLEKLNKWFDKGISTKIVIKSMLNLNLVILIDHMQFH